MKTYFIALIDVNAKLGIGITSQVKLTPTFVTVAVAFVTISSIEMESWGLLLIKDGRRYKLGSIH